MNSNQDDQQLMASGEQELLMVLEFGSAPIIHGALVAAVELNLFEIIAKVGPEAKLSSVEIASHLPTQNEEAPALLDRILLLLSSYSILKCILVHDEDGHTTRTYGLTPLSQFFVRDKDGISMIPVFLGLSDKAFRESCYSLKDAILEGGIPFNKAYGMNLFEYLGKCSRLNDVFNLAMHNHTHLFMRGVFQAYKGFEDLKELVDVGGGFGATLDIILSMYPTIQGINFDLPHVIKNAPNRPGINHVEGDMFEEVPKGDAILLKNVLHDWSDEHCLKLLKNCWEALPEFGKVIAVEMILPESPETNLSSKITCVYNVSLALFLAGAKERTLKEYNALAKEAGFGVSKLACCTHQYGILEFYKN